MVDESMTQCIAALVWIWLANHGGNAVALRLTRTREPGLPRIASVAVQCHCSAVQASQRRWLILRCHGYAYSVLRAFVRLGLARPDAALAF